MADRVPYRCNSVSCQLPSYASVLFMLSGNTVQKCEDHIECCMVRRL